MATLNINGQRVTVDDSFLSLSPEQQEATVNEIAQSLGGAQQTQQEPGGYGSQIFSGLLEGATGALGAPIDLANSAIGLGMQGINAIAGTDFQPSPMPLGGSAGLRQGLAIAPESTSAGHRIARQLARPVGASILPIAGTARNLGQAAAGLASAVGSGLGEIAGGMGAEAIAPGNPTAKTLGEMAGGIGGGIGAGALAGRVISPYGGRISPERLQAAETLRAEGVNPTAGQTTGSRALLARESELGGSRTASLLDDQARAYTEAAMRRAGASGTATPDNMAALDARLGRGFKDISARNTLTPDQTFVTDVNETVNRYGRLLESQQRPIVENIVDDLAARMRASGGALPGPEYQAIRSDLGKAAQSASNQNLAGAFRGIRNALDNAMARSVSPEDAAEWARLRSEYGNMKVLEKAATGAGEAAAAGNISPARLRQAAVTGRAGQYARGEGSFDELARAGNIGLPQLPTSGTAERMNARTIGGIGTALGAGGGAVLGNAPGAMVGAMAGAAAPYVAGRALMSSPVQSWLTNQAVPALSMTDPRTYAVASALLAQSANRGGQ